MKNTKELLILNIKKWLITLNDFYIYSKYNTINTCF